MAATEAARRTLRTSGTNRTTDRRGAHAPSPARIEGSVDARGVTPAFHITPNVVIATRGSVRSDRRKRRGASQRELRRFAV